MLLKNKVFHTHILRIVERNLNIVFPLETVKIQTKQKTPANTFIPVLRIFDNKNDILILYRNTVCKGNIKRKKKKMKN